MDLSPDAASRAHMRRTAAPLRPELRSKAAASTTVTTIATSLAASFRVSGTSAAAQGQPNHRKRPVGYHEQYRRTAKRKERRAGPTLAVP